MKKISETATRITYRHKEDNQTYDCVLRKANGNTTFFRRLDADRWIQIGPEVVPLGFYLAMTAKQTLRHLDKPST